MARNEYMEGLAESYWFPDRFQPLADSFFKAYRYKWGVTCPDATPYGLKPRSQRTCRFCGRQRPFVSFKKDAHIISELLGNHYLVGDFECDECNEIFSKYEDHLGKYLGVARALMAVAGKTKNPKFKATDKGFIIESWEDPDDGLMVSLERETDDHPAFSFDESTNIVTVTCKKHPFVPLYIYKALVKMALSCIPEDYLREYLAAFEYVRGMTLQRRVGGFEVVNKYTMAYTFAYERPTMLIFEKKDPDAPIFRHMALLFAMNNIYQFGLPLNQQDARFYGERFDFLLAPPLFSNGYSFPIETILSSQLNLSSTSPVRDSVESFSFVAPLDRFRISGCTDAKTGEFVPERLDPSIIKGVIFSGRHALPGSTTQEVRD